MSSPTIAIVDYQAGNLRSVQKALERFGANAVVTSDPHTIETALRSRLPRPGRKRPFDVRPS